MATSSDQFYKYLTNLAAQDFYMAFSIPGVRCPAWISVFRDICLSPDLLRVTAAAGGNVVTCFTIPAAGG